MRDRVIREPDHEALTQFARNTVKAAFPNFPAPLACVDAVAAAVTMPFDEGLLEERRLFMRLFTGGFVEGWTDRIINIHPSLLPAYKGLQVHERVIADGVRFTGCTVHIVRPEMDSGPIIAQAAVPVIEGDNPKTLAARVLAAEHRLYPLALGLLASGRARIAGDRVIVAGALPADGILINPAA